MCGICGIFSNTGLDRRDVRDIQEMNRVLKHRGPDDEGYALINTCNETLHLRGDDTIPELKHLMHINDVKSSVRYDLCMGHRRLSIIDVSARGHQPMIDAESGSWIVFNGEIYNYVEIRSDLIQKGHSFRTLTDTEVILKAYREWGTDCLSHFNGMWAFALWDSEKNLLFCSRDRFGVKPFYYFFDGKTFVFSSEIKSLLRHSQVPKSLNEKIAWDYLVLTLIDHCEETFFEGIMQLLPGHFLTVNLSGEIYIKQYYKLNFLNEIGHYDKIKLENLSQRFLEILEDSVKIRLRSDVPVASYLSGGIDSSTLLCMVQRFASQLPYEFTTFSAVYDDANFDERQYIMQVIHEKKINPLFFEPQKASFAAELNQVVYQQDEPFLSTAIYAQWALLKKIRENGIKVILTGDGADEVLCGYPNPYISLYLLDLLKAGRFPELFAELKAHGYGRGFIHALKGTYWHFPSSIRIPIRKTFRIKPKIIKKDFFSEYLWREKMWMDLLFRSTLQERLYLDMTRFLLPHELRFREKNAMAFSVEERQPFLDYRLVEFCFNMPAVYKIHLGWRKYLLRRAVEGILPSTIQWRKNKLGFGTYELRWFLNTLELCEENNHKGKQYVNFKELSSYSKTVPMDEADKIIELWSFYNFELWMRVFDVRC
jgi:asparagine synthase (glutamine-hydrolysing)